MSKNIGKRYECHGEDELYEMAAAQLERLRELMKPVIELGQTSQVKLHQIILALEKKLEMAVAEARRVPVLGITHTPLLCAVSKECLGVNIQMHMLELGYQTGGTTYADADIHDIMKMPKCPAWWLIDVEDGYQFYGKRITPKAQAQTIKGLKRLDVCASGVIALEAQTGALRHHRLYATGSSSGSECVISLLINEWGRPELNGFDFEKHADGRYCAPSCLKYI